MTHQRKNHATSAGIRSVALTTAALTGMTLLSACNTTAQNQAAVAPCSATAKSRTTQKACNPCAAKKAANPCAAKKACNPCGANRATNPCALK